MADVVAIPRGEEAVERPAPETAPEPKLDSETVKAQHASPTWRQVHDSSQSSEAAETQAREKEREKDNAKDKEIEQSESIPSDTAARAMAAGAEQLLQEAAAASAEGDQSNVASIVDSVLADLRPSSWRRSTGKCRRRSRNPGSPSRRLSPKADRIASSWNSIPINVTRRK